MYSHQMVIVGARTPETQGQTCKQGKYVTRCYQDTGCKSCDHSPIARLAWRKRARRCHTWRVGHCNHRGKVKFKVTPQVGERAELTDITDTVRGLGEVGAVQED